MKMASNEKIQNLFLICMSSVYLIAFVSLFVQIPGLYGDDGILPVRLALSKNLKNTQEILTKQPTLLHFLPRLGLKDVYLNFNLIVFIGIVVSFATFVFKSLRNAWCYLLLFVLYESVMQVGQTFLWFQWDTLLLETGLLTVLVAPFTLPFVDMYAASKHGRTVAFWLVKWLVFRLMFCSGVVKLNSKCPTWWGLTAMNYHYETQCIPTPLSWFFHHLPTPFHRFSTAMVFVIQVVSSILFFSPFRLHRKFSFAIQTSLMILILLTGNYNFFNVLSIFLLLSLLDDSSLPSDNNDENKPVEKEGSSLYTVAKLLRALVHIAVFTLLLSIAHFYMGISFSFQQPYVHAELQFNYEDLQEWLHSYIPITIGIASLSLAFTILAALFRSFWIEKCVLKKLSNLISTALISSIVITIFATSLVPYTDIDKQVQHKLPRNLFKWYTNADRYNVINAYGLFRSMTGVGGRPEVVVEGRVDQLWKEYEFYYKPGNINKMPPFVAPHQPRLDWQMWFAALGSYTHNPWLFNMVYRLLNNQPEVLALIEKNPFPSQPPKYIRAHLYHYHFSTPENGNSNWWKRTFVREYMPEVSLEEDYMVKYAVQNSLDSGKKGFMDRHDGSIISIFFNYLHHITPAKYSFHICTAVVLVALTSLFVDRKLA